MAAGVYQTWVFKEEFEHGTQRSTQGLVGHRVSDVIEDDAKSKSRKLLGVLRLIGVFPGVAEMHVVADRHHDAPMLVADGPPLGDVAVVLISYAGADILLAGDLKPFVDIV